MNSSGICKILVTYTLYWEDSCKIFSFLARFLQDIHWRRWKFLQETYFQLLIGHASKLRPCGNLKRNLNWICPCFYFYIAASRCFDKWRIEENQLWLNLDQRKEQVKKDSSGRFRKYLFCKNLQDLQQDEWNRNGCFHYKLDSPGQRRFFSTIKHRKQKRACAYWLWLCNLALLFRCCWRKNFAKWVTQNREKQFY